MPAAIRSTTQASDAEGLNDHIAVRIVRIAEALSRISTRTIEARWGLKNTDLRILNTLDGARTGLPVSEIARQVHVDKAWISRSVRDLVRRGLLVTRPDAQDPRRTIVELSPDGVASLAEVRPFALQSEAAMLKGINTHELKAWLDRLEDNSTAILDKLA